MMQQVEASVVLLGEVNVGHQDQDLDDAAEIFSNGVVERCVSIRILCVEKQGDFVINKETKPFLFSFLFKEMKTYSWPVTSQFTI